MQFLPLIFIGLIIFFTSLSSAKARRRQEEARRAAEERLKNERDKTQTAVAQKPNPVPRQEVPKAAPPRAAVQARTNPVQKKPEAVANNAEKVVKEKKQSVEEKETVRPKQPGQAFPQLNWNQNTAMQGIVYAEILGKPKALRRK